MNFPVQVRLKAQATGVVPVERMDFRQFHQFVFSQVDCLVVLGQFEATNEGMILFDVHVCWPMPPNPLGAGLLGVVFRPLSRKAPAAELQVPENTFYFDPVAN